MLDLVAPAPERSLLTIEDLRAAAGVTGTGEDDALRRFGRRVSDIIAAECGVAAAGIAAPTLLEETLRETIIGRGQRSIRLSRRFVGEVLAITADWAGQDLGAFELDAAAGMLRVVDGSRTGWRDRIVVTYKAGFPADAVPEALKHAASLAVRELHSAEGRDPLLRAESIEGAGRQEYQIGGSGRDKGSALPIAAAAAIEPFITVHVA